MVAKVIFHSKPPKKLFTEKGRLNTGPSFLLYKAMNKRQKKKREKKILLWELEQQKPKIERYGLDFNNEGYIDRTAAAAIRNVMKDERVR